MQNVEEYATFFVDIIEKYIDVEKAESISDFITPVNFFNRMNISRA